MARALLRIVDPVVAVIDMLTGVALDWLGCQLICQVCMGVRTSGLFLAYVEKPLEKSNPILESLNEENNREHP